ncbi:hypothetical protein [Kineococcus sp. SYSU DK018]|uniref:hypothetical protein n=1 Tax=Kineococcus sp. SYSU DK018 TaxID=3383139 RepID=UPI003D7DC531
MITQPADAAGRPEEPAPVAHTATLCTPVPVVILGQEEGGVARFMGDRSAGESSVRVPLVDAAAPTASGQ